MNGQDIYTMYQAGAVGVQMGTAFLVCEESTASSAHKRYLINEWKRGCIQTSAFSGRPALGIKNKFTEAMESAPILEFPLQNTLTSMIRSKAVLEDNGELQSLWAGKNYWDIHNRFQKYSLKSLSVQELMTQLHTEFSQA